MTQIDPAAGSSLKGALNTLRPDPDGARKTTGHTRRTPGDAALPEGEVIGHASVPRCIVSLGAVVVPLLGLVAGMILLWGPGFGWTSLGLLLVGYFLTGIGITVGYHRLFTHKSFDTNPVVKFILGVLGSMAIEGPVIEWCARHRAHHQHSDRPEDPHSPHKHDGSAWGILRGFFHAHCGWFFREDRKDIDRYVPDLKADKVTAFVDRWFLLWAVLGIVLPGAIALAITGTWMGALLGVIWGGLVRVFLVHHITWSVNSVCHIWGSRPFRSHDHSRNNALFGVLAFGEGWHNNHHAFPTSARHGLRWWQFDSSYLLIRTMSWLGLAKRVRVPARDRIDAARAERPARR